MSQEDMLWGIGLPALVCAAFVMAIGRPWMAASSAAERWLGANAVAAGLLVSYLVARGWSISIPPGANWEWLPLLAAGAAVAVGYGLDLGTQGRSAWTAWSLIGGLCAYLLVAARLDQSWAWRGITAAMIVGAISATGRMDERTNGGVLPLLLGGVAAATAVLLQDARMETLAQLSWALAACLAVIAGLAWWRPSIGLGSGGLIVVCLLLPGLAMSGYFAGGRAPAWCFVVAAAAPAAPWLTELPFAERYVARSPLAFQIGSLLAAAGVAAAGALLA